MSAGSTEVGRTAPAKRGSALACFAVFLLVFAAYALSAPGRIDMVDGQVRYEAASELLETGSPQLRDRVLNWHCPRGRGGCQSRYGPGGTISGMFFILFVPGTEQNVEIRQFAFSLASPAGGAVAVAGALALLLELGVALPVAIMASLATAFATLLWPVSTTVFTHAQTAALMIWSLVLGARAAHGKRGSLWQAFAAGALGGLLFTFDEYLIVLLPALAMVLLEPPLPTPLLRGLVKTLRSDAALRWRLACFIAGTTLGLAAWMGWNYVRFANPLHSGKADNLPAEHPLLGNPLAGFLGLLISPGKGIIWFSPMIVWTLLGVQGLWRRAPTVAAALVSSSVLLLLALSPVAFYGGDWCWGPRYLSVLIPLWSAAWPFVTLSKGRRWLRASLLSAGVLVQLLGLSLDHHRFFMERDFEPFFWGHNQWLYFHDSQLLARPGEILRSVRERHVHRPLFIPNPYQLATYCPLGPPKRMRPSRFETYFRGLFLPRPWPLWAPTLKPYPADQYLLFFTTLGSAGAALLVLRIRRERHSP